jgi:hypothetical protein
MNKQETLGRIAELEAQIKADTAERDKLRLDAVTNGWAKWTVSVRINVPNLQWWKENKPRSWKNYCKSKPVNKFTVLAD